MVTHQNLIHRKIYSVFDNITDKCQHSNIVCCVRQASTENCYYTVAVGHKLLRIHTMVVLDAVHFLFIQSDFNSEGYTRYKQRLGTTGIKSMKLKGKYTDSTT